MRDKCRTTYSALNLKLPLKMVYAFFAFLIVALAPTALASPVDTYVFNNEVTKKRYNELVKELRCPKCQNQNLADSNSPIAKDLRQEVYELLHSNKSDGEIVDFMVKRYGEFVLYRPRLSSVTYVLWLGPFVLILIGVGVVIHLVRSRARTTQTDEAVELNDEQQQKLNDILNNDK